MRARNGFTLVKGFTLVELLVVIGIIALLISVLVPALGKARTQANFTKCLSNQRQLLIGLVMYCNDNRGVFPGGSLFTQTPVGPFVTKDFADSEYAANNPYSLNQSEVEGSTFLMKYVKGSAQAPLMFCPVDDNTFNGFTGSGTGGDKTRRTSYRYSKSLFYPPQDIFLQHQGNKYPQVPQKLTSVKHPTKKAAISDGDNYHNRKQVGKIDELAKNGVYVDVAMGFVDGHVEKVNTKEMFDYDINWTGRSGGPYASEFKDESTAGVKGRDVR